MNHQAVTTVTIELTPAVAERLWTIRCRNFIDEQPYRFECISGGDCRVLHCPGTLYFCDSTADAVLLRAYEQRNGFDASLVLHDGTGSICVVSSRPVDL